MVREATINDVAQMSDILMELFQAKKRIKPGSIQFVRERYLEDPDRIACSVVVDEKGNLLGFQSLKHAREGNPYNTPVGWGIIGTHVRPSAARQGVGSRLFAVSKKAALEAGLSEIEACIGADNVEGLAYYEAMGFRTYRHDTGVVCKCFKIKRF